MKNRNVFLLLFILFIGVVGCKKEASKEALKEEVIVKFAKYNVAVYKDIEMKNWAATLVKTEPVFFIENLKVNIKGKNIDVAKVNLSDYTTVYVQSKHLGNQPIVFTEDTKAYVRNNKLSSVYIVIPKGTIGFIEKESDEWSQVYVGKINNKWLTKQWVNGGFSNETSLIQEAVTYERAIAVLEDSSSKQVKRSEAIDRLKELSASSVFATLSTDALDTYGNEKNGEDLKEGDGEEVGNKDKFAVVTAEEGLKILRGPGVDEEEIAIVPSGNSVEIIDSKGEQVTIAGKTSQWYKIKWRDKQGWVFGAFLEM